MTVNSKGQWLESALFTFYEMAMKYAIPEPVRPSLILRMRSSLTLVVVDRKIVDRLNIRSTEGMRE